MRAGRQERAAPTAKHGAMPRARTGRALAVVLLSTGLAILFPATASAAVLDRPAQAAQDDPTCLTTDYTALPATTGPPIRFGVDPELAGDAGPVQLPATPLDDGKVVAALQQLQPPNARLVQRLNRLFESDGEQGIARFQQRAAVFEAAGFDVELQVRYHPDSAHDGDLPTWLAFVRQVVDSFGRDRHVVSLTITNEVNLPISSNTSDGSYKNAKDALLQGVVAARREADAKGYDQLQLGFTYAYRSPQDNDFFSYLGEHGTPEFRAALDFIGLDLYPGTVVPPVVAPGVLRSCLMPMARLDKRTSIWLTENGYPSAPAPRSEDGQVAALRETVDALCRYRGTFGVTDYRYFNLRDNASTGAGVFAADGLLADDYRRKPAFAAYRDLVAGFGQRIAAAATGQPRVDPPLASTPSAQASSSSAPVPAAATPSLPRTGSSVALATVALLAAAAGMTVVVAVRRRASPST